MVELDPINNPAFYQDHPGLEEWFKSGNRYALYDSDKRLPSPEEKIELSGGLARVQENLVVAQRAGLADVYLTLLFCDRTHMDNLNILRGRELISKKSVSIGQGYVEIRKLLDNGLLEKKEGLTRIANWEGVLNIVQTRGYVATNEGLARRVGILETGNNSGFLGRLFPGLSPLSDHHAFS